VKGAADQASLVAPRALALDRAAVATGGAGPVDRPLPGLVGPFQLQHLPAWAAVDVALGVVGEGGGVVVGRGLVPLGQRHVGTDTLLLQGANVLARGVLGIGDQTRGPQFAAE
jgi:hypothetical protein